MPVFSPGVNCDQEEVAADEWARTLPQAGNLPLCSSARTETRTPPGVRPGGASGTLEQKNATAKGLRSVNSSGP
jgi:hypothetical protein